MSNLSCPHLISCSRSPEPKRGAYAIFNYILRVLYTGGQWKELAIEKDAQGVPEIHYTRIYSAFRRGQARIESCAQIACVHHDIIAMPMAYITLIGDMGTTLSGGQKQRVLLARALAQVSA